MLLLLTCTSHHFFPKHSKIIQALTEFLYWEYGILMWLELGYCYILIAEDKQGLASPTGIGKYCSTMFPSKTANLGLPINTSLILNTEEGKFFCYRHRSSGINIQITDSHRTPVCF